jgi:hypothetical protein
MKPFLPLALALLAGAGAAAASAQPAATSTAERRIAHLIVYGDDPCPQSTSDEIVVCARRPEDDRYRIPEALRGTGRPLDDSWAARSRSLEFVGRGGIQSCSTVGPGGFTGCWAEMMRQANEDGNVNAEGRPVP